MNSNSDSKFWLKESKKSLGDTLNRISSFKLPAQKPARQKAPQQISQQPSQQGPSDSYIRMEQLDRATHLYSYSAFLHELEKHSPAGSEKNVAAVDLFIRSLRPDVKVTCSFNQLLKRGSIELVRCEESVRATECMCPDMEAMQGRSLILNKRIRFDINYQKQCIVLTNVTGLQIGIDVVGNFIQAEVNKMTFRTFDGKEYLQVFYVENPLARVKAELSKQVSFIRAAFL